MKHGNLAMRVHHLLLHHQAVHRQADGVSTLVLIEVSAAKIIIINLRLNVIQENLDEVVLLVHLIILILVN